MKIRILALAVCLFSVLSLSAQNTPAERSFSLPVATVQSALRKLPGSTSGSLPLLDGFVVARARSLDNYERPYYQCSVHVTSTAGGSLVRVSAKITAWNNDPAHPGYQVLQSNGRIESDLLDRLERLLDSKASEKMPVSDNSKTSMRTTAKAEAPPSISAPTSQLPSVRSLMPPSGHGAPTADPVLEREAKSLEDILRNQAHPTNLVAVKQELTPVLQTPSTDATVLFLANAEDEFEVLNMNPNWVYVRISGLARGWLRRSSVDVLNELSDPGATPGTNGQQTTKNIAPEKPALFSISSEATGSFPGEWPPLKGKSVKIISVQPTSAAAASAADKLQFAESEFKQAAVSSPAVGVVLIFDSEDGGMVATTGTALDRWKSGAMSEEAFWKQCYVDPPEIFGSAHR